MTVTVHGGRRFTTWHKPGATPTVVFETGLGAEASEWAPVADALSRPNAVFYYDRLNRGTSDRVDGPRTSRQMAADLRGVLTAAGVAAPYVLVGHSFGAHVVLAFSDGATDVAGVVLVDPTHPRQFDTFGPFLPEGEMSQFWTEGWRQTNTTPEHIDFPASFAATDQVALGAVPLTVLSAGAAMGPGGPDAQRLWLDLACEWLRISPHAQLDVVEDSGHFIQRERPERVVRAVQDLLGGLIRNDLGRFGPPIDVRGEFGPERAALLDTLESLTPPEWMAPTACPGWTVKDVAAHVLGDDLSRLARTRDGFSAEGPRDAETLADFLDRINDEWVRVSRRVLSPQLVMSSLRHTGDQIDTLWGSLAQDEPGEGVSWAGPGAAPVWLDAARDFSEYWVHHQQIREAVGKAVDLDAASVQLVLDTFLRALPFTLRFQDRPDGTRLTVVVAAARGGAWTVQRIGDAWAFVDDVDRGENVVTLDADTTWRLCTRGIVPNVALERADIAGDAELGAAALHIVSIIWSG